MDKDGEKNTLKTCTHTDEIEEAEFESGTFEPFDMIVKFEGGPTKHNVAAAMQHCRYMMKRGKKWFQRSERTNRLEWFYSKRGKNWTHRQRWGKHTKSDGATDAGGDGDDDNDGTQPTPEKKTVPKAKGKPKPKGLLELALQQATKVRESYKKAKDDARSYQKLMDSDQEWKWLEPEFGPPLKLAVTELETAEPDFAQHFALSTPQQLKKRYSDGDLAKHCDEFSELKPKIEEIMAKLAELVSMKEARDEAKR